MDGWITEVILNLAACLALFYCTKKSFFAATEIKDEIMAKIKNSAGRQEELNKNKKMLYTFWFCSMAMYLIMFFLGISIILDKYTYLYTFNLSAKVCAFILILSNLPIIFFKQIANLIEGKEIYTTTRR